MADPGDGGEVKLWQCYDGLFQQTWTYNAQNGAISLANSESDVVILDTNADTLRRPVLGRGARLEGPAAEALRLLPECPDLDLLQQHSAGLGHLQPVIQSPKDNRTPQPDEGEPRALWHGQLSSEPEKDCI